MRFLVLGEFHEDVRNSFQDSGDYDRTLLVLREWESKGIVERYELFSDRIGGCVTFNAPDHKVVEDMLEQLPFMDHDGFDLTVCELVD